MNCDDVSLKAIDKQFIIFIFKNIYIGVCKLIMIV